MPYVISIVPPKTYGQRIASSKDGYSMGRGALHYRQGSRGPDARLGLDGSRHSGLRSLSRFLTPRASGYTRRSKTDMSHAGTYHWLKVVRDPSARGLKGARAT